MKRTGSIAVIVLLALALLPATAAQAAWRAETAPIDGPTVVYIPVPVAPSDGITCRNEDGILGVIGGAVSIHWAWPTAANDAAGSGLSGFNIYHQSDGSPVELVSSGSPTVGAEERSWTMPPNLVTSLVGGLFGLQQTLTVTAVVDGVESPPGISQPVTFVLASTIPLRLASVSCG